MDRRRFETREIVVSQAARAWVEVRSPAWKLANSTALQRWRESCGYLRHVYERWPPLESSRLTNATKRAVSPRTHGGQRELQAVAESTLKESLDRERQRVDALEFEAKRLRVKDLSGKALAKNYVWSFATGRR
jgi:hypothetical protein